MSEFRCTECRDVAPELALDVLTGRTRARAVAHLSDCAPCLEMVSSLALVADRLVELLPEVEPPAGFEGRVVSRITVSEAPAPRRAPVAAALVMFLLTAFAWVLGGNGGEPSDRTGPTSIRQPTVLYAPLKLDDRQVGGAFLYPGDPGWIHVSVQTDLLPPDSTVRCHVVRSNGSPSVVGEFRLLGGRAEWEALTPIDTRAVTGTTVSDMAGRTLGTARFVRAPGSEARPRAPRPALGRPAGLAGDIGIPGGHPEARRSGSDHSDTDRDDPRTAPTPDRDTSRTARGRSHPGHARPGPDHGRPDHGRPDPDPARSGDDPGTARSERERQLVDWRPPVDVRLPAPRHAVAPKPDRDRRPADARPPAPRKAVPPKSDSRTLRGSAHELDRRAQPPRTTSSGKARSEGATDRGSRATGTPDRGPVQGLSSDRKGQGRTAYTARPGTRGQDGGRNAPRTRPSRSAASADESADEDE